MAASNPMLGRPPTTKQLSTLDAKLDGIDLSYDELEKIVGSDYDSWDMADVSAMIGADLTTADGQRKLAETIKAHRNARLESRASAPANEPEAESKKTEVQSMHPVTRNPPPAQPAEVHAAPVVPDSGIGSYVPSDAELENIVLAMKQFEKAKRLLLGPNDIQEYHTSKGDVVRFIKKSGWNKLALAFRVSTEIIDTTIRDGIAMAMVRATWGGKSAVEVGAYSIAELRKRKMPETDANLISTAVTRATNRAISRVLGSAEVSAEEVDENGPLQA